MPRNGSSARASLWPGVSLELPTRRRRGRTESKCGLYWYDKEAADRAVDFFPRFLRHFKGQHAGQPFELLPWQEHLVVRPLVGWKRKADGLRRFRKLFLEVAKKNGKTAISAGLGLYFLHCDDEAAAEVYVAAADAFQAGLLHTDAKTFTNGSPELLARSEVWRRSIVVPSTHSSFHVLSSEANTKHGPNVHVLIMDEFHTQPDRELYETLQRGTAARLQPVVILITTAGHDRDTVCFEEYEIAKQVLEGTLDDPTILPVVFEPAADDDWREPATWHKANPSLGDTVQVAYLETECKAAIAEPRKEASFKRLHLNIWTQARTVWIPATSWESCLQEGEPDLTAMRCTAGLDLSATTDMTALSLAFVQEDEDAVPDPLEVELDEDDHGRRTKLSIDYRVHARSWAWIPEAKLRERQKRDQVPYDLWIRQGWLRVTEGDAVDYDAIRDCIVDEIQPRYAPESIGYDPWNAMHLVLELGKQGATMVEVRQGYASLSGPSKLLEALVASGRMRHNGDPLLRWSIANTEVRTDPNGNIRPVKPKPHSRKRIDPTLALVMALSRLMLTPKPVPSRYAAGQGLQVISWG